MALRAIQAFGSDFDLIVSRPGAGRRLVLVVADGKVLYSRESVPDATIEFKIP